MTWRNLILTLFFICLCQQSFGLVSIGHYSGYVGKWQKDSDGGTESPLKPWIFLGVNTKFHVFGSQYFFPELGLVLPRSSHGVDAKTKRSVVFLMYNLGWQVLPRSFVKYGLGTFVTRISGDGEAVERNNGSSTATFYVPSETVSSYNTTVNFGFEQFINEQLSFKIEHHIWSLFNSDKRRHNFRLAFSFYLQ